MHASSSYVCLSIVIQNGLLQNLGICASVQQSNDQNHKEKSCTGEKSPRKPFTVSGWYFINMHTEFNRHGSWSGFEIRANLLALRRSKDFELWSWWESRNAFQLCIVFRILTVLTVFWLHYKHHHVVSEWQTRKAQKKKMKTQKRSNL